MEMELFYPQQQSIAQSSSLFRLYKQAIQADEDKIVFNLTRSKSLTPLGIIVLTATVRECQDQGKKCTYLRPDDDNFNYFLDEIGFHNFFGIDGEGPTSDSIETGTIQLKKIRDIDTMWIETMIDIFDFHLKISQGVKDSLWMSLIETMTNVVDHSGVNEYFVCAWTDQPQKQIRVCIADLGKGIYSSLKTAPEFSKLEDDYEAIRKSVENGVSSRPGRAGLGLNHITRFIKINEGQCCIISGEGKVFWKFDQGKIQNQKMPTPFDGTIVKLIINIDKEGFYFLADEKDYLF